MSRLSYILMVTGLVFFVLFMMGVGVLKTNLLPIVWVCLGIAAICFAAAIFKDRAFFADLLGQRTTKHGLNLGALVLIVLAILVGVNFVGFRHSKKFDTTKESVNSLSDQTKKILSELKGEVLVKGFFTESKEEHKQIKRAFTDLMDKYTGYSNKVKVVTIDPIRNPEQAKENEIKAIGQIVVEYNGRKTTLDNSNEQSLTNGIIRVTREKSKNIYYITGHGEHPLESADVDGVQSFKKLLEESKYVVKPLDLSTAKEVPADADLVLVMGPKQEFLDPEVKALRKYLYTGGKLFVALDPGNKPGLQSLLHDVGVEFENSYAFDAIERTKIGPTMIVAETFSPTHPVTKGFTGYRTGFLTASPLKVFKDKPDAIKVDELVKSHPSVFALKDLSKGKVQTLSANQLQPQTFVTMSQGLLKKDPAIKADAQEFMAVVAGDSDFVTNNVIHFQLNQDLAMNLVSYLAKDKDLVSIRPKQNKASPLFLTPMQFSVINLTLMFVVPFAVLGSGIFVWYRRRTA